ncbi:MAG: hypothetical protein QNJ63_04795 [Calothrix sp. MO_192.B10]|nr:hypothetical protein [Calothrix sp. MO_192.B10]
MKKGSFPYTLQPAHENIALRARELLTGNREQQAVKRFQDLEMS